MDHGGAQQLVHELVHWASAVVLVIGGAVVVGLAARARRRGSARPAATTAVATPPGADADGRTRSVGAMLASLSLGAATIHLAAAPSHYIELGDLGAGFLVAAVLQAAWARSIVRDATRRTIRVGVAINATILVAWLVSRTIGLPLGPTPFIPERVGLPDGLAATFEALLVLGLVVMRLALARRVPVRLPVLRPMLALLVVPVLGLVMLTTSLASLAIVAGAEHGMPGGAGAHAEVRDTGSGN
jgi:hypothetical protein